MIVTGKLINGNQFVNRYSIKIKKPLRGAAFYIKKDSLKNITHAQL